MSSRLMRAAAAPSSLKGYCCFTFDDTPSQDLSVVVPILNAQGIKGTFCCLLSAVGSPVTWSDLQGLAAAGHEIVNHSATHVNLIGVSDATLTSEITTAQATFVSNSITPTGFCWPGHGSDAASRAKAALSLKYALGAVNDGLGGAFVNTRATVRADRYQISRVTIVNGGSLAGYKAFVDSAVANKGLVVYLCHAGFDLNATTQSDLNSLIDYVQATNLVIDTAGRALKNWGYQ